MSNMYITHLQTLRTMGLVEYRNRANSLAERIATVAQEVRARVSQEDYSSASARELVSETYGLLKSFRPVVSAEMDAVTFSCEGDPIYPVMILGGQAASSGERSRLCYQISWPVWRFVRDQLTKEEQEFVELARTKSELEEALSNFKHAKRTLDEVGIDCNADTVF